MLSRLRFNVLFLTAGFVFLLAFGNVYAQEENWVIYLDMEYRLFSVPASGGEPIALVADPIQVRTYRIAASGHVIYVANDDVLYSIPITGESPVALSSTPLAQIENNFQVSSDGNWALYLALQADNAVQLYSIPVTGGASTALIPDDQSLYFNPYEIQSFYFITADSSSVVFTAQSARGVFNLFAVPIQGGEAVQINERLASGGHVLGVQVHENRVVYLADQVADGVYGLFATSLAGGTPIQLNAPDSSLLDNSRFDISADGSYLIYQSYGTSRSQLFSVPIGGGASTALTDPIDNLGWYMAPETGTIAAAGYGILKAIVTPDGQRLPVDEFSYACCIFSPDGQRMLVMSWAPGDTGNSGSLSSLYSYPIDSGLAVPMTLGDLPLSRDWGALFSPDGQYVAFIQADPNGINQFYAAPADGSSQAIKLNGYPGSTSFGAYEMGITADSSTFVYINDEEAADFIDLYSVPITGGTAVRLTPDDSIGVQEIQLYPRASVWRAS